MTLQYLKINVFGKNISVLVSGLGCKEVGRLHFYLYNQKKLSKPNTSILLLRSLENTDYMSNYHSSKLERQTGGYRESQFTSEMVAEDSTRSKKLSCN